VPKGPPPFDLGQDILTRGRHISGDDHLDILCRTHDLPIDLRARGEVQAARYLHEDTRRYERVVGDDRPDTLRGAHGLAIDLRALRAGR
jgi:hypothetical protein